MLLPWTIGIGVAIVTTMVLYTFYEDILDLIDWIAHVNTRRQQRFWKRIVEMKREKEKEYGTDEPVS